MVTDTSAATMSDGWSVLRLVTKRADPVCYGGRLDGERDGQIQPRLAAYPPGTPDSAGTRILFTVEPPGTAVLLAAGRKSDWLRAWYTAAITACRVRYQREQERHRPGTSRRTA